MGESRLELHQTSIMKFVALALALLLAVGTQGASLQADAPSQLAHIRAAMDVYMTQVKESAKKALDQLDDTEYKAVKEQMSQRLEDMHNQIKALQTSVSPATAGLRAAIEADVETLKTDLEPKRIALKEVIDRHIAQYSAQLEPLIAEHYAKHVTEMDALKTKLEPIVEDLRAKVAVNIEETKNAMMPIVEAVRAKVSERLEELKNMAKPYVDEYKAQMKQAYDQAKGIKTEDLTALKDKIAPLAEDVKTKLQMMAEIIMASVNQS